MPVKNPGQQQEWIVLNPLIIRNDFLIVSQKHPSHGHRCKGVRWAPQPSPEFRGATL